MIFQPLGGPLAELGAAHTFDAIANGQDHLQAVELGGPLHLSSALGLNCQGFLDSSAKEREEEYMFKIFRKLGQSNEMLDKFYTQNAVEALTKYYTLCQCRTDGAGCVILAENSLQVGYYRTDKDWPEEGREQTDQRHWIYGLDELITNQQRYQMEAED